MNWNCTLGFGLSDGAPKIVLNAFEENRGNQCALVMNANDHTKEVINFSNAGAVSEHDEPFAVMEHVLLVLNQFFLEIVQGRHDVVDLIFVDYMARIGHLSPRESQKGEVGDLTSGLAHFCGAVSNRLRDPRQSASSDDGTQGWVMLSCERAD